MSVVSKAGAKSKWTKFWSYFRTAWLGRYDTGLWNVHSMHEQGIEIVNRTNNPLERYSWTFGEKFPTPHPSVLAFMETAKQESLRFVRLSNDIKMGLQEPPNHAEPVQIEVSISYTNFN
ncbi:hypothetical protein PI125_g5574 [Phytophthora idaei]|nr:hypothetical protein PI125_g5574 [Phytophthora idaei]